MKKKICVLTVLLFCGGCTDGIGAYLVLYDKSVNREYEAYVAADSSLSQEEKQLRYANVAAFGDFVYTLCPDACDSTLFKGGLHE